MPRLNGSLRYYAKRKGGLTKPECPSDRSAEPSTTCWGDWGYAVTNHLSAIGAPIVHFNMFSILRGMKARDEQERAALARLQAFRTIKSATR